MITYRKNNFVVIQPVGRLDLQGGMTLSQAIAQIQPDCDQAWVIDLNKVDFVDSAGLTALVDLLNTAHSRQCHFVLCNPCPSVKLVLEITRLDQVFQIVEAVENPDELALALKSDFSQTLVSVPAVVSAA